MRIDTKYRPNMAQCIAAMLLVCFAISAFFAWDPKDTAGSAVFGMLSVLCGFVVYWEDGMKKSQSPPDFDVTGPGDAF